MKEHIETGWVIIFWHSLGWTISSLHNKRMDALRQIARDKQVLPDYKYKAVRCEVSFKV